MHFQIRDSRSEDFSTLYQIDQLCFPKGIAYTRFELAFYMRRRGAFTLVASVPSEKIPSSKSKAPQSEIAGFIVAETRNQSGHVITIDVLEEFRRHGLGSKLLQAAEQRLKTAGSRHSVLETAADNLAAQAFYQRHGYVETGKLPGYYANGVDALVMKKDLLLPDQIATFST